MVLSFTTNFILFLFELIVCDKLATKSDTSWSICFIPLFILSFLCIGTCIWSIRYDRTYEIELFCALNILQFVFIALRLDYTITWSWVLVLIPLWILMCISLIILLYVIIFVIIMTRNNQNVMRQNHQIYAQQNQKCSNAIYYTIFVFSVLIFEILLTAKLDHEMFSTDLFQHFQTFMQQNSLTSNNFNSNQNQFNPGFQAQNQYASFQQSNLKMNSNLMQAPSFLKNGYPPIPPLKSSPFNHSSSSFSFIRTAPSISLNTNQAETTTTALTFFLVSVPLQIAYFALILLSFSNHSGNLWWFGMRRDFCELFLIICPVFKIYGNIQLKLTSKFKAENSVEDLSNQFNNETNVDIFRPINLGNTVNTNVSNGLTRSNAASLFNEEQTPCLPASTTITIDNDLVSNEASILKFNMTKPNNRYNDTTTINTNNLVDTSNGNQSVNECDLSIDLESCSLNPVPNVLIRKEFSTSHVRLNSEATNNRSLQIGINDYDQNSPIENTKSLSTLNQVYYSSNENKNKEQITINLLNAKQNVNTKPTTVQSKTNVGNIIKLDMPD